MYENANCFETKKKNFEEFKISGCNQIQLKNDSNKQKKVKGHIKNHETR